MCGVTTPCVDAVVDALKDDFECLVFHATGVGGQSMEKLVDSGSLVGVIDITTTEVCDLLFGGVLPATEDRFGAIVRTRVPYIGSCGALDMVNFGPMASVPDRYRGRTLHVHNPTVTLMRTTPEENARLGRWIAVKDATRRARREAAATMSATVSSPYAHRRLTPGPPPLPAPLDTRPSEVASGAGGAPSMNSSSASEP